jgi:HEAT repeat protein
MHPSGFVREAAVRALSARPGAVGSMPFYLVRRNDWVEQVRSAAIEALDLCAKRENAEAIVEALPLVYRLVTCTRADHAPFVARIEDLLGQPGCEGALRSGIASPDPRVRRACFSLAFGSSSISRSELLPAGLRDLDPIVRLGAARTAASAPPEEVVALLDQIERDPYTAVRQVGLDARISLFPDEEASAYERHLLDRSVSIRGQAQRGLGSAKSPLSDFYRSEIQSGQTRSLDIALLGLSEVGSAADADLASGFLDHPLPRVRAAAVRAVARLSSGDLRPMLYVALEDGSPRVSRAARTVFLTTSVSADPDAIREILDGSEHRHAKVNAISVAQNLARWQRLHFLLRACVNSDSDLASRAALGVCRWLDASNRAALNPTADEVRMASRLLNDAKGRLPGAAASELAFLLRTLGGRTT